jgi:anaerobic selenocysteine-containing dehydrogenase
MGGRRIQLDIPELLVEVARLELREAPVPDEQWPFVLSAGERRAFTANTIIRDPNWRKRDRLGALRMSETDAGRLGVRPGQVVRVTTRRGHTDVPVETTARMRAGHLSLPNGYGLGVAGDDDTGHEGNEPRVTGAPPNELTSTQDRDEWVGTPWHKHVPARVELL